MHNCSAHIRRIRLLNLRFRKPVMRSDHQVAKLMVVVQFKISCIFTLRLYLFHLDARYCQIEVLYLIHLDTRYLPYNFTTRELNSKLSIPDSSQPYSNIKQANKKTLKYTLKV